MTAHPLSPRELTIAQDIKARGTPQLRTLFKHMSSPRGLKNGISDMEARLVHRINALPRRISDLTERFGVPIRKERREDPTGRPYVRYFIDWSGTKPLVEPGLTGTSLDLVIVGSGDE